MQTRNGESLSGFWDNVDPKVKKGVIIGAGVLTGFTVSYIGYRVYRRWRSRQILKQAIHDGTLASIVEKIDIALVGMGTDEEKVYEAISDIETQTQADRVAELYKTAYEETLDEAYRGDLNSDEIQTVKNIVAGKPKFRNGKTNYDLLDSWIRRLSAAKGTFSTDEDAIYRVLWEVPDRNGYSVLSNAINTNQSTTGYASLHDYLVGQLDETEQSHAAEIMARKK
jgi:hypothetical protein